MYDNEDVDHKELDIKYGGVTRPDRDINMNKKDYYGTVSQLDNSFSRLISLIDDQGLSENTLIIFTSDNGPEHPVNLEESKGEWDDPIRDKCFGTPGIFRGMKRYPYEGGHRVPGIVRWPGKIPANTTSDVLFNGTDIAPVICNLAGISMPEDREIDGVNAFNAFLGNDINRDENCLWIFPTHGDTYFRMPHMAMRKGDYSLAGWFPERKDDQDLVEWMKESVPSTFALFNLAEDPSQENDLSLSEPGIMDEMIPELISLWTEIRDEGPVWGTKN
jgi:arylsulfatase A-like enzyme